VAAAAATNVVLEAAAPATNAASAADATTTNADATVSASTNAPATGAETIPLIQFSDVPITTAIEHLARQAGINYMLDPKIGYGQPDQNGQARPEPQLSIRWENITAQNALLALLDNYGLQLIMDKRTGIDRVALKDPTAPPVLITRVLQLQYASVSNMTEAVQSVFSDKRSRVIADVRTSQMLVVATDPEQTAVDTLVTELDKPTRQVLIETKLIQISSTPSTRRGVDWSSTLSAQTLTFGNGSVSGNNTINTPGATTTKTVTTPGGGHTTTSSSTAPFSASGVLNQVIGGGSWSASTLNGLVPATAFLNADGLEAVVSFINASYDAQIYSTPRIVTLDNQPAHIEVIRTYPVISMSGSSANNSASASVTFSNVGTVLDVTPRISANDKIWLNVIPEVSDHFADVTISVSGGAGGSSSSYPVPIFDRRKMQSQVMIPNGNTLVMGGLVQDSPSATYSKVPFLGDIPGLGWAFHSETKSMSKDNLLIFLTPTIVRDSDFQPNPSTFLQSKPKTMGSPMNPNKIWDGAEPEHSWSNPAPIANEFDPHPGK
jgi:type II secretory pathway component GspD/PulD (secretin)